jgi:hypothetical protein
MLGDAVANAAGRPPNEVRQAVRVERIRGLGHGRQPLRFDGLGRTLVDVRNGLGERPQGGE